MHGVPRYIRQAPRPCPVLDPVKPIIQPWPDEDETRPPFVTALPTQALAEQGCQGAEGLSGRRCGGARVL